LPRLSGRLYALVMARRAFNGSSQHGYLDRPNIFCHHEYARQDRDGTLLACRAFDIVTNDVALLPGSDKNAFLTRLEQGVLDTNVEALHMAGCGKIENTAETFTAADRNGSEWVTINI